MEQSHCGDYHSIFACIVFKVPILHDLCQERKLSRNERAIIHWSPPFEMIWSLLWWRDSFRCRNASCHLRLPDPHSQWIQQPPSCTWCSWRVQLTRATLRDWQSTQNSHLAIINLVLGKPNSNIINLRIHLYIPQQTFPSWSFSPASFSSSPPPPPTHTPTSKSLTPRTPTWKIAFSIIVWTVNPCPCLAPSPERPGEIFSAWRSWNGEPVF